MRYDRKTLKENAKAAMAAANPKTWLVTLIFFVLVGAVSGTLSVAVPNPLGKYVGELAAAALETGRVDALLPRDPETMLRFGLGTLGTAAVIITGVTVLQVILRIVMSYGYCGYSLEVYRREPYAGVGSLFKGFPRFGGVVGSAFLAGLFSLLWGLLIYGVDAAVTVLVLFLSDSSRVGTWIGLVALFFAASLIHTLVTYRYCLTPYFIMDNRKMPASHAVTASVRAMRGNVLKCLVLKLSFLGWELLRGLIATAMAVLASIVFMLVAGGSIGALVDLTGQGSLEMSRDARFVTAMLLLIAAVLIIFGLALLAQLPLKLWLTSYENVAFAGFYQALAGETAAEELSVPAPAAVSGSAYFSNVQPAVPVTPFTPPVGEDVPGAVVPAETEETEAPPAAVGQELPPVAEPAKVSPYTPFGGSTEAAPEAPEAPVAPKEPAAPEEPEN